MSGRIPPDETPPEELPGDEPPFEDKMDASTDALDSGPVLDSESTATLWNLLRQGDPDAKERLLARCLPRLTRWAHNRLPAHVRGPNETLDVVQDAVLSVLKHLDHFNPRHEGALMAYLRTAVHRRIIDLIRQARRRPTRDSLPEEMPAQGTTPFDRLVRLEDRERLDRALEQLDDEDRQAIICRMELQYSYEELAVALSKPTPNAARVAVHRAIRRLLEILRRDRT